MSIINTYSKQKKLASGSVDVFTYENFSLKFRNQISHALETEIGPFHRTNSTSRGFGIEWKEIERAVRAELGVLKLKAKNGGVLGGDEQQILQHYIQDCSDEEVLDLIVIAIYFRLERSHRRRPEEPLVVALEINQRFYENAIGYQVERDTVVRVDSKFLHTQVILPALDALRGQEYSAADAEFRLAHEHYRFRRFDEAATEAGKSFESVMKVILTKKRIPHDPSKATAKNLIEALSGAGFTDGWMNSVLQAPATLRNKIGSHGDGVSKVETPAHLAHYCITEVASAITFLVSHHSSNP